MGLPGASRFSIPWKLSGMLALFTWVIWEVNLITYRFLDKTNAFFENPGKRILMQILYCTIATWLSYTLLYFIIFLIRGGIHAVFPVTNFLLFLGVATTIAWLINSLYIIQYLRASLAYKEAISTEELNKRLAALQQGQEQASLLSTQQPVEQQASVPSTSLLISSANTVFTVPFNRMAYWYSAEGLVVLVLADGKKMTTDFPSYASFISQLPDHLFFRLNRQFVAHISSITAVKDDNNRKLIVELKAGPQATRTESVVVSRYRSQEFKTWFVAKADREPD